MSKWKVLDTKEVLNTPFCRFRIDRCELPDGRIMPKYYVLDFTDWVNIVPVTENGEIVLIRQYRHGSGKSTLEIPGGALDARCDSSPQIAAVRELEEETGYTSDQVESLGVHYPNPALQSNQLHTFIAYQCKETMKQNLDPFEDISVELMSVEDVIQKVYSGEINHSLIVASLFLALRKFNLSPLPTK